MARKATATPIPHHVVAVSGLRLTEVTTGALLAQHRVGNAVPESLQIGGVVRSDRLIQGFARNENHAARGVHQVFCNRRHTVGVTAATSALCILKFARESDQPGVRVGFDSCLIVAGVTSNTAGCGERMRRTEPVLPGCMALQTGVACSEAMLSGGTLLPGRQGHGKQEQRERQSARHTPATLAEPWICGVPIHLMHVVTTQC